VITRIERFDGDHDGGPGSVASSATETRRRIAASPIRA
jgi:hypothetical protein